MVDWMIGGRAGVRPTGPLTRPIPASYLCMRFDTNQHMSLSRNACYSRRIQFRKTRKRSRIVAKWRRSSAMMVSIFACVPAINRHMSVSLESGGFKHMQIRGAEKRAGNCLVIIGRR
jgi:hypothetical protein